MFILVKYGNNETLLCNPSCAVINLLHSIKTRAGYGKTNVTVDLSDDTGELQKHAHAIYRDILSAGKIENPIGKIDNFDLYSQTMIVSTQ